MIREQVSRVITNVVIITSILRFISMYELDMNKYQ